MLAGRCLASIRPMKRRWRATMRGRRRNLYSRFPSPGGGGKLLLRRGRLCLRLRGRQHAAHVIEQRFEGESLAKLARVGKGGAGGGKIAALEAVRGLGDLVQQLR